MPSLDQVGWQGEGDFNALYELSIRGRNGSLRAYAIGM
jgi:hypothetical protein